MANRPEAMMRNKPILLRAFRVPSESFVFENEKLSVLLERFLPLTLLLPLLLRLSPRLFVLNVFALFDMDVAFKNLFTNL